MIKPTLSLTVTGVGLVCLNTAEFHHLKGLLLYNTATLRNNPPQWEILTMYQEKGDKPTTLVQKDAHDRAAAQKTQRLELRKGRHCRLPSSEGNRMTPTHSPGTQSCTVRRSLGVSQVAAPRKPALQGC